MISSWLIRILLCEYLIILIVCTCEGNWKLALYWLGASILQTSVIWMAVK